MSALQIEIRSFRSVFTLERRIYRIDSIRLNPAGIPLRGVGYAAILAAFSATAGAAPLVHPLAALVPWYLRDVAIPTALGSVLAAIRIEGRVFHSAVAALARHAIGPRRLVALRSASRARGVWRPGPIIFIADGSEARPRNLRYRGPGVALIRYAHCRVERQPRSIPRLRQRVAIHPDKTAGAPADVALALELGAVLEISDRELEPRRARIT
jgi:hypothetical protein